MNTLQFSDQELLELIKKDQDYLGIVYKKTKDYCINFMRNMNAGNNINDFELDDIYQDAILILYEKIVKGNFKLTASFQTYLSSVCRFQLLNKFKKFQKDIDFEYYQEIDSSIMDVLEQIPDQNEIKFKALEKALTALKKAGGKCYELLAMFWYQKKSMNEIAVHFRYTNDKNAKNQKSKCQKRLKTLSLKYLNE